jgi:hypothetical protein
MAPLDQNPFSEIHLEEERAMAGEKKEIAAWLVEPTKTKWTEKQMVEQKWLRKDGQLHKMSPEDFKDSTMYQDQQEKIRELQERMGNKIKLPLMVTEDGESTFLLLPLTWILQVKSEKWYVEQFPLHLGYAVSSHQLGPSPPYPFTSLTVTMDELKQEPLLLLSMLENVQSQENVELLPFAPTPSRDEAQKILETQKEGNGEEQVNEYMKEYFVKTKDIYSCHLFPC